MAIPNDICRCHDAGCSERFECLRWLDRETGSETTPHSPSLMAYDEPIGDPCSLRIDPVK